MHVILKENNQSTDYLKYQTLKKKFENKLLSILEMIASM